MGPEEIVRFCYIYLIIEVEVGDLTPTLPVSDIHNAVSTNCKLVLLPGATHLVHYGREKRTFQLNITGCKTTDELIEVAVSKSGYKIDPKNKNLWVVSLIDSEFVNS